MVTKSTVFYEGVNGCGHNDQYNDSPLLLTDLIRSGRVEEARTKAEVKCNEFQHVKSYAGYFTINKLYNSNTFFWFFPAEEDYENAPLLLWLQGGPGSSSLTGLFMENGPFMVTPELKIQIRTHRWTRKFSMIYIDNPVGVGYSFTDAGGYVKNQTIIGEHLYEAFQQFYQLFPELQKNDLFLTGQSYAGKYIPSLAYKILKGNSNGKEKIRLQGLAIGNAYADPINQFDYSEYLYQIGLIDSHIKERMYKMGQKAVKHIENKEWLSALNVFSDLIYEARNNTLFQNSSGYLEPFNFLELQGPSSIYFRTFLQRKDIRNAIHVGNSIFHDGVLVAEYLEEEFSQSVAPWISELLEHYPIMFYNGQVDLIVPYPLVLNVLNKLNFSGADLYKTASRHKWYVGEELAGYIKQGGNLIEVLVRLAGHMVPLDQPEWSFDMITRFVHNRLFD
ncbi:hypothetical protein RN001_011830 [Aquatica leii]|uniref:Carboxypeptidase n=1 Tax=Aquatica leii TaxID=1421715 RepID=A0AAN7P4R0_9COLE|nr:hypothetical protein RN001_011830 [Aquatica leii]